MRFETKSRGFQPEGWNPQPSGSSQTWVNRFIKKYQGTERGSEQEGAFWFGIL